MDIKVIIFDLDGTLLNTLDDLADSTNLALAEFGYPPKSIAEIKQYVGNGVAKLIERAIPNGKDNIHYNTCLKIFKIIYAQNMYNKTAPYNGIINLLIELKEKNYKIAVVSNKFDLAVKELCQKYFPNLIDIAIGENEAAGINKKPAPDTVNLALKQLKLTPNQAIYVGDSDVDILTAKNSNMPCISVTWGFRDIQFLKEHNANIIINDPKEIIDYLK